VANPPTLLLAVQSLLRRCSAYDAAQQQQQEQQPTEAAAVAAAAQQQKRLAFLQRATPVLNQWVQWLLNTQRHSHSAVAAAAQSSDSPEVCGLAILLHHLTAVCFFCS
jgi:Glycosyl hydrolase family 63 C-terminal domain